MTDVFLHDLASGTTERVSVDSAGGQAATYSYEGTISGDGAFVAFTSNATTLAPGNQYGLIEVFVKERATGRVSIASCNCGEPPGGPGYDSTLSHDGEFVAFVSGTPDLVSGDTNGVNDTFVLDRAIDAPTATTYGSGFTGSNGIPTLAAAEAPAVGTTFHLAASDSSSAWTIGFLLVGTAQASTPTGRGGTILVAAPTIVPFVVPPFGASLAESIPFDPLYAGALFDVQVVEADPGAQYGLSFTAGLELKTGR